MLHSSIWLLGRTLSDATTPGQCRSRNDGNEGVFPILQSSSITGASLSDCLVSYLGNSFGESNPTAETQSVYSIGPANWNWNMRVIAIVIVTLETVPKGLAKRLEEFEIRGRMETTQTTGLFRSARILRWEAVICCQSNSNERPLANAGVKNSVLIILLEMRKKLSSQIIILSTNDLLSIK